MREKKELAYSKRCLISHRPPFRTGEPVFFRCPVCGSLTIRNVQGSQSADETSSCDVIMCCGKKLEPLHVQTGEEIPEGHQIGFTVFGGFEENSVRVTVDDGSHPMREDHRIEWIYYRSFQGGQLKYLPIRGRSTAIFSFADEDSYVYCDRDICRMGREHCQFMCKRGNMVYAYCTVHGLMKLELLGF